MSRVLKIVVAEPSLIVRSGVISVLKRLNEIDAEVYDISDIEQLKDTLNWRRPDILMVNPVLVGVSSLPAIKKAADNKDLKCVALQLSMADGALFRPYDEVITLYDTADQIKDKLMKLVNVTTEAPKQDSLSAREKEVVVCVVKGMSNKQIAEELFLSTHTVITHRRNISAKLQIHSTAGLTIYAIVNKLVDLDDISDKVMPSGEG